MLRTLTLALLVLLSLSCGASDPCTGSDCYASSQPSEPVCTATYQGPTSGDLGSTCEYIYEQRCEDGNEYMADQNCDYALSDSDAAACPYCPAPAPPPTSSGYTISTSCNASGVAYGCSYDAPYSCDASGTCFSDYGDCVSTSPCTY